ncbi:MAG: HlyD family efflux transporter periplasmic adaptor subunit [Bacteroidota bacterium]
MYKYLFFLLLLTAFSCQQEEARSDAYGNFEATATTIGVQAQGQLHFLNVEEGQEIEAGKLVALVDTMALHLQRLQVEATIGTLPQKLKNALADIAVLEDQKSNLVRERDRVQRLLEKEAATSQQLDELNGNIDVVEKQMAAIRSQTEIANRSILAEKGPLLAQVAVLDEKISKAYIHNPIKGTVLTKLAEAHEVVGIGAPLYRIGQLDTMTLRFYVDAVQLQDIKIGDRVEVLVDDGAEGLQAMNGILSWIAEQAEFTPKIIQTKEDRVNLVYAVKALVPNPNGLVKIGMPAEVNFESGQ